MRRFAFFCLLSAFLYCVVAQTATAQESFKPAVVVRLAPIEGLIGDMNYLVKQTQRDELGKQVEDFLKGMTGKNGLEGVDTKKPIGAYTVIDKQLDRSQVMLLVPIADEKVFLRFLDGLNFKPLKGDDGVYTVAVNNVPVPVLMRFAHGYAYATPKFNKDATLPEAKNLPKPEAILGKEGGAAELSVHIDQIPESIRKLAVSSSALYLGNLKDEKREGETEKQQEFRGAVLDELAVIAKMLLEEGGPVNLKAHIDTKSHDLSLTFTTASKSADTKLAKIISELGKVQGLAGLIGKDSALGGFVNLALPGDSSKHLTPVVNEALKAAVEALDDTGKKLVEPLTKALENTASAGVLDLAIDLRGPKNDKYTIVTGVRIKDGDKAESALVNVITKLPEEARSLFKLDAHKAKGERIHEVKQTAQDEKAKTLFGDGPVYFAITKDTLLVSMGVEGLEAMKSVLKTTPAAKGLVQMELSLNRMAPLIAFDHKNAVVAAKKAFTEKDSDKVTLTISGGEKMTVRLRVKTAVLNFAAALDPKNDAE